MSTKKDVLVKEFDRKVTIDEFRIEDMPLSCTWFVVGAPGTAKCSRKGTEVLMANGKVTTIEQIKIGDKVMGDDSKPRTVKKIFTGKAQMYKYESVDGSSKPVYFTGNHTLPLKFNAGCKIENKGSNYSVKIPTQTIDKSKGYSLAKTINKQVSFNKNNIKNAYEEAQKYLADHKPKVTPLHEIEVEEFLKLPKSRKHHLMAYRTSVEFLEIDVTLDPYYVGLWLGDGHSRIQTITNIDLEVIDYLKEYAGELGMKVSHGKPRPGIFDVDGSTAFFDHSIINDKEVNSEKTNYVMQQLKSYNLIMNKHIPHDYKCNSKENRMKLLAGLIDTDGSFTNNSYYCITQKNTVLADDIIFLGRSLGFYVSKNIIHNSCMYKGEKRTGEYVRMNICSTHQAKISDIPVKIQRKIASKKEKKPRQNRLHYRFTIEEAEEDTFYGIEIDGNHRYLLGDFTVTRNCVSPETPIMMFDKRVKQMKDISVGELVMGDNLTERKVIHIASGKEEMFEISIDNDAQSLVDLEKFVSYKVNKSHILSLLNISTGHIEDIPLQKILPFEKVCLQYRGVKKDVDTNTLKTYDIQIKSIGQGDYMGFELYGDNCRFLLGDGTITHNTTMAENFAYYLKHRYPVAKIFVQTEEWYKKFCRIFHPLFVSNNWDEKEEERHVLRQRKCELENGRGYPGNYAINILDDIGDDPKVFKTKLMRGLFKLGSQHWAQLLLVLSQFALDLVPEIRKSVSYVALGREPEENERQKLYKNFGGICGKYPIFCQLMEQLTGDFTFMIIKKRSQSNKLEDCVFWYRTKQLKDWKFGCKEYRKHGDTRYNPKYVEKIEM